MTKSLSHPTLIDLFGIKAGSIAAIVGGGGKSSLMNSLAAQWEGQVVSTTTTRIFRNQITIPPSSYSLGSKSTLDSTDANIINDLLKLNNHCLVYGSIHGDKALGVGLEVPQELLENTSAEIVIVEADGSRMRPCKAPAEHEPAVPDGTTLLIPTVGIDAVGRRLVDAAHRPERAARITGLTLEEGLDTESLAALITHPEGGLKNAPQDSRIIPFINKVESEDEAESAREIATMVLKEERIEKVILGSLRETERIFEVHRRITAVVLAAGKSDRMGEVKQLLAWGDRTVLGQTLSNLRSSKVHDILVVVGYKADAVKEVATRYAVPTIFNSDWNQGEMVSSLQAAVRQLPGNISAVLVVLADQPMVESKIIDQIVERYWRGDAELIAPVHGGRRGNPVLIGQPFFKELMELHQGQAPRHLLRRHREELALVEVGSDSVLMDLDLPEDYERWRPSN